uniref:Uncharacterized protein n=1 Tax=Ditylenchus dipsaci TaxID=166011 RepID=A0A915CVB9_9BILA
MAPSINPSKPASPEVAVYRECTLSSQFLEIQAVRSVPAFWSSKICELSGVRSECVILNESAVSLRSELQPVAEAVALSARIEILDQGVVSLLRTSVFVNH